MVSVKSLAFASATLVFCTAQALAASGHDHAHALRHAHKPIRASYVALREAPAAVIAPQDRLSLALDRNTEAAISIQESNHGDQHN